MTLKLSAAEELAFIGFDDGFPTDHELIDERFDGNGWDYST